MIAQVQGTGISTEQQKKNWLINWYFENDPTSSIYLATLRNPALVASYQTSPGNLYGTPFAIGMENYFQKIKTHFGQSMFDQLLTEFAQQSNLYVDEIKVDEWHIYGSSRLGVYEANRTISKRIARDLNNDNQITNNEYVIETPEEVLYLYASYQLERGAKRYELTNHLGNVLTVISDKKTANFTGTNFTHFTADRISATDYSPFGAPLAGRTWNGGGYRFGFNSKEIDLEGMGGGGSTYDYGFRVYNPNLGKFLSVDPLTSSYPWYTPFQFAGNKPIFAIDLDGLEEFVIITQQYRVNGKTFIYRVDFEYIEPDERADGYKSNGSVLFLDNGFNRMLNQRPKVFTKSKLRSIIRSIPNSICANCSNEKAYIMAKNGQKNGETYKYIFPTKVFSLDNDEGNTLPELESRINSSEVARAAMDEIVGRLYYDPNSKASVLASADPSPTNVDGTKSTTETEHNLELAQQRLQAGVELLKKYYKDTFGVDLADDRILKPTPQTNKDRSISFSISTDQR